MSDYIVHKSCEKSKLLKGIEADLEFGYVAQPKYDGCYLLIKLDIENDTVEAYSRTGEVVKSVDHIKAALLTFPDVVSGVYHGECWCPDMPFNEISGTFRRQYSNEESCRLQFVIFDFLTLKEWDEGYSSLGYIERVERLPPLMQFVQQGSAPLWLAGSFGFLHETLPGTTAQDLCNKLVEAGGYDGAIFRHPLGAWIKGDSGRRGEIIKVKAKLSYALRVVGWKAGKGRNATRMGNLLVEFKGQPLGVGTGFSDAQRELPPEDWMGKIIEVEAMGFSSEGLLREPRFKGIRTDVTEPDA